MADNLDYKNSALIAISYNTWVVQARNIDLTFWGEGEEKFFILKIGLDLQFISCTGSKQAMSGSKG